MALEIPSRYFPLAARIAVAAMCVATFEFPASVEAGETGKNLRASAPHGAIEHILVIDLKTKTSMIRSGRNRPRSTSIQPCSSRVNSSSTTSPPAT